MIRSLSYKPITPTLEKQADECSRQDLMTQQHPAIRLLNDAKQYFIKTESSIKKKKKKGIAMKTVIYDLMYTYFGSTEIKCSV